MKAIAEFIHPYLDNPFAFFGHSMGALISFELARLLRKDCDCSPVYLLISGCRVPQVTGSTSLIHSLPDDKFLEELRRLNGTSETILSNKELVQFLLPMLRADFSALETYTYYSESLLTCPIMAFGGSQDLEVNCDMLDR